MPNDQYIPQLLLRRFASRVEASNKRNHHKHFVWQHSKESPAHEKGTWNVASEANYYISNAAADENLKKFEGKIGEVLGELDKGEDPNRFSVALWRFTMSLAFRTKAFPQKSTEIFTDAIGDLTSSKHAESRKVWIRQGLYQRIEALPDEQAQEIQNILANPHYAQEIEKYLENSVINGFLAATNGTLGDSFLNDEFLKARNDALAGTNTLQSLSNAFPVKHWKIQKTGDHPVVLGDVGPLACDRSGNFSNIIAPKDVLEHVILPLSHNSILVGSLGGSEHQFDIGDVNKASAQMSHHYFCASESEKFDALTEEISSKPFVSTDEVEQIAASVFKL